VTANDQTDPYPNLDLNDLIDLTPDAAVSAAEAEGVKRIRVTEIANGLTVGSMDLVLARNRLDLFHQGGRVVFAAFPANRPAGEWPRS
jgi:hypothetical protein